MQIFFMLTVIICFGIVLLESCDNADEPPFPISEGKSNWLSYIARSGNYLYILNNDYLQLYAVSNGVLDSVSSLPIGRTGHLHDFQYDTYQSIFAFENTLFIRYSGSDLYDISQPGRPIFTSTLYLTPCDPIVIKNNLLITAILIGGDCHSYYPGDQDELDVIDIGNKSVSKRYSVKTPYSLSLDGNTLFVAHGDNGLSVYDAQDPLNMTLIKFYSDIKGVSLSAEDGLLLVTGANAILQYDYTDLSNLKLISSIPIQQ